MRSYGGAWHLSRAKRRSHEACVIKLLLGKHARTELAANDWLWAPLLVKKKGYRPGYA